MGKICMNCGKIINKNSTECQYCNSPNITDLKSSATLGDYFVLRKISRDPIFLKAMLELHDTDPIEFQLKMSQFKAQLNQQEAVKEENNKVKCPKCGCTNIQVVRRNWSFLRGFATNKTDRVCTKCNYKW